MTLSVRPESVNQDLPHATIGPSALPRQIASAGPCLMDPTNQGSKGCGPRFVAEGSNRSEAGDPKQDQGEQESHPRSHLVARRIVGPNHLLLTRAGRPLVGRYSHSWLLGR